MVKDQSPPTANIHTGIHIHRRLSCAGSAPSSVHRCNSILIVSTTLHRSLQRDDWTNLLAGVGGDSLECRCGQRSRSGRPLQSGNPKFSGTAQMSIDGPGECEVIAVELCPPLPNHAILHLRSYFQAYQTRPRQDKDRAACKHHDAAENLQVKV